MAFSGETEFAGYRFRYETRGTTILYTAINPNTPTAILEALRDRLNRTRISIEDGMREMDRAMLYRGLAKQSVQGTAVIPSPMGRSLNREWPRDAQGYYLITDERAEAEWLAWQAEVQARICAIFGIAPDSLTSAQRDDISDLLSFIDGRYSGE